MDTVPSSKLRKARTTQRATFLAKHLHLSPIAAVYAESAVYDAMGSICPDYNGGSWDFYETSAGAGFMAPASDKTYEIRCQNTFAGTVPALTVGIIATLYALSSLSFRWSNNDAIHDQFHLLRAYAATREDREQILSAID